MGIQSVIFDKKHFTVSKALNYLKRYGLKNIKPAHITGNYIRMRIEQPIYQHYITKEASDSGVKYIVGF